MSRLQAIRDLSKRLADTNPRSDESLAGASMGSGGGSRGSVTRDSVVVIGKSEAVVPLLSIYKSTDVCGGYVGAGSSFFCCITGGKCSTKSHGVQGEDHYRILYPHVAGQGSDISDSQRDKNSESLYGNN